MPELTKYDLTQPFYYEIPCDCEFSPIYQNGAIADMKTPFKSILKQTITPYYHTYGAIWKTNYYGTVEPCEITYVLQRYKNQEVSIAGSLALNYVITVTTDDPNFENTVYDCDIVALYTP